MIIKYRCGCEETFDDHDDFRPKCYKHNEPMTPESALTLVRSSKLKVVMASTELVDQYDKEIDEILKAIGVEGALVTDESSFHDFLYDEEEKGEEERLSNLLGVKVYLSDLLVTVAAKMRSERRQ